LILEVNDFMNISHFIKIFTQMTFTRQLVRQPVFVLIAMVLFQGCKVNYSFTGASIPPEIKTINIKYFPNNASLVAPSLSQKLTDELSDRFTSQTDLTLVNRGGDLILEGYIKDYKTSPVAIQGNDQAALNRLTITIFVKYTDTFDDSKSFETTFSKYADYSSSQNLTAVQDGLIDSIVEMLVTDVFNKAVINW